MTSSQIKNKQRKGKKRTISWVRERIAAMPEKEKDQYHIMT